MSLVLLFALLVVGREDRRRREDVRAASRRTIPELRRLMCGRTDEAREITFGVAVGSDREALTEELVRELLSSSGQNKAVIRDAEATRRLLGAAETQHFDFRVFGDADLVVAPIVGAFWQELLAAYPRARIALRTGSRNATTTTTTTKKARVEHCVHVSAPEARGLIAIYGSACPSEFQKLKIEELVANGILDHNGGRAWILAPSFPTYSNKKLVVCPGLGATATKSLGAALRRAGLERVAHYENSVVDRLVVAAEDERFDWGYFRAFDALLDTPIPGFWRELVMAFPNSKVVLTVRDDYRRDYSGILQHRRQLDVIDDYCHVRNKCEELCRRRRRGGQIDDFAAIDGAAKVAGDKHCRITSDDYDVRDFARVPALRLTGDPHARIDKVHKSRLPMYMSDCPSHVQATKSFRNINNHVVRILSPDRLLVMDITKGDGYALLCPFLLDILPDAKAARSVCRPDYPLFPSSKPPLQQQQQRRLYTPCVCATSNTSYS
ncbi:hypothetical protein CTAYLR_004509 [Chrysophaeum taylorii]|uniref:Uncharacterized protein n=1 Tax=Chrysophaeum taylorii TaxID=2483200 RepID=A0AAD7UA05_9STRA|nr:hypothetical protein CTAYLR_004509 [Chrysophaeum taylorii]